MKRIIILIGLVLASPILAQAQNAGWQIPPGANTPRAANTPGTPMNRANVDIWGNQLISLQSGTASATNPVKPAQSAFASTDAGIVGLGVRNTSFATVTGAQGTTGPFAITAQGAMFTAIDHNFQPNPAVGILKLEDAASASGDALVGIAQKLQSALTVDASSGDYGTFKGDESGRLVTTSAPSAELLQGCNVAITTATTGTIVNAVASKFNFITGFTCTNTGATATRIIIEDGDGVDMANAMLPATVGYATATFPGAGIKTNVVNKSIQVNVITAGSSTICCVSGHVGTL